MIVRYVCVSGSTAGLKGGAAGFKGQGDLGYVYCCCCCLCVGFTNHKEIVSWKYSTTCSVCIQQSPSGAHIEAIAFSMSHS